MKKFLTGVVCGAAIAAASVVLLPVAAIKIAAQLSKPREKAKPKSQPDALPRRPDKLPADPHEIRG